MNRDENLWERTPFEHTDQDESVVPWGFPQSATHPLTYTPTAAAHGPFGRARVCRLCGGRGKQEQQASQLLASSRKGGSGWMYARACHVI